MSKIKKEEEIVFQSTEELLDDSENPNNVFKDYMLEEEYCESDASSIYANSMCEITKQKVENGASSKEATNTTKKVKKTCPDCDFVYTKPKSLEMHNAIFHTSDSPFKCSECSFTSCIPGKINKHIYTHTNDFPYPCVECDQEFRGYNHLLAHRKDLHSSDMTLNCNQCDFTAPKLQEIRKHKETYHKQPTNIKLLKCDTKERKCSFVCTTTASFELHKIVHETCPPYQCSECEYSTSNARSFDQHIFIHTRDKPFSCPYCELQGSFDIRRHIYTVHSEFIKLATKKEDKPKTKKVKSITKKNKYVKGIASNKFGKLKNQCPHCYWVGSRRTMLKEHLRINHPNCLKCEECDFVTTFPLLLKRHKSKHHTIYSCSKCPFTSTNADTLVLRKLVQSSKGSVFLCSVCRYLT